MADKNIGLLPKAPDLYDDSLMVVEQQGTAMSLTGLQFKQFAQTSVKNYVQDAKDAAAQAAQSAQTAKEYSGNPPDIINEQWWIWDATLKAYVNTGEPSRGDDGTVLRALYPTYADMIAAHPTGNLGDAYAVGDPTNWTAYIWDVDHLVWAEIGQLGGGIVNPDDVVKVAGGATLIVPPSFGNPPYTIEITDEPSAGSGLTLETIVLTAADWDASTKTQIVAVPGVLADGTKQVVQPRPDDASVSAYVSAKVKATAFAADSLTFACTTIPVVDIIVNIFMEGLT